VHFLQQAEPFPDKPDADRLAGWLSAQHLALRFADASSERIVAEADLRLRFVVVPRLADEVPAERVIVPLFPYHVITVVIIPAAGPAARRRTLRIASEYIPAMQSTKTVVLAAGCKQTPGAAILKVESFVAGILTIY